MSDRPNTLLTPGNPAWAELSREKRKLLRPADDATVAELLLEGVALSHQAVMLLNAVEAGDEREHPAA